MNRQTTIHASLFQSDLFAVHVFVNELILSYPDQDLPLIGDGIHRIAPLLAMDHPLPSQYGEVYPDLFPPSQGPTVAEMTARLRKRSLARPLCLPPLTEWVLFDPAIDGKPKWLVRLCDMRRITLSRRGRVCVVLNDFVFALTPHQGVSGRNLFDEIDSGFPKRRDVAAQPGEISAFSMWPGVGDFLQPFPAFRVKRIELLAREEDAADLADALGDTMPQMPNRTTATQSRSIGHDL